MIEGLGNWQESEGMMIEEKLGVKNRLRATVGQWRIGIVAFIRKVYLIKWRYMLWFKNIFRRKNPLGILRIKNQLFGKSLKRDKVVRNLAMALMVLVIGGSLITIVLFIFYARSLPSPDKIVRKEGFATKIFDRNGELLYEVFVDQQRTAVVLEQVPEYLRQATIAIEDKSFYAHGGFDPKGILRSIVNNILRGTKAGGSTLTQQLVKNVLLTGEKRISRKIKEFILAVQIESNYNKDQILQMYLNEAPYGGTAWGVSTAAQTYFGKEVKELNLVESAILAGMPQRPSVYTPFGNNPTAYVNRTKDVLRRMKEDGYITRDQEASAAGELEGFEFHRGYTSIKAPHFVIYVKQLLEEMYGSS